MHLHQSEWQSGLMFIVFFLAQVPPRPPARRRDARSRSQAASPRLGGRRPGGQLPRLSANRGIEIADSEANSSRISLHKLSAPAPPPPPPPHTSSHPPSALCPPFPRLRFDARRRHFVARAGPALPVRAPDQARDHPMVGDHCGGRHGLRLLQLDRGDRSQVIARARRAVERTLHLFGAAVEGPWLTRVPRVLPAGTVTIS